MLRRELAILPQLHLYKQQHDASGNDENTDEQGL
jgi:hypothetical protein